MKWYHWLSYSGDLFFGVTFIIGVFSYPKVPDQLWLHWLCVQVFATVIAVLWLIAPAIISFSTRKPHRLSFLFKEIGKEKPNAHI